MVVMILIMMIDVDCYISLTLSLLEVCEALWHFLLYSICALTVSKSAICFVACVVCGSQSR